MNNIVINGKFFTIDTKAVCNVDNKNIDRIVVHGSRFHADDVFCVAMAFMCNPKIEVLRVNQVSDEYMSDDRTIVADIGFGKYDHHQVNAEVREDGSKYASCGLLFRDLKGFLFDSSEAAEVFERKYILPVEIADNGGKENPLSDAISAFNATWDSCEDGDAAFARAVAFVLDLIWREKRQLESEKNAEHIVKEALKESDGKTVILPKYMPWRNTLIHSTAIFVIYPSQRGGFNLQTVPRKHGDRTAKLNLPEQWIHKKPEGCTFVHPALFLASFSTAEFANRAAVNLTNDT